MNRFRDRLIGAVALYLLAVTTLAEEYQQVENIAAESAEEASVGLQDIPSGEEKRPMLRLFHDSLAEASPFWRESSLVLSMRGYDFQRKNSVESVAEESAVGTELTFRSGKWRDRLSTVVSWHTSFAVDDPEGIEGGGLLGPDQSDLSVISRAYVQYDFSKTTSMLLYRQDFNMPYINRKDSRMIPNTHEAYVLKHPGERVQWLFGHVTKMKQRDSDEFVSMGEIAGVPGNNAGTTVAAARYKFSNKTTLGTLLQHTDDLFTTVYTEANIPRTINEDWGMHIAAQLTNQWSTGEDLLGDFSTYSWGLRGRVSYRGAMLTAAYTNTGSAAIQTPFGGTPGFTDNMLFDFDRAREEAFRIGLSQNLAKYGLPGIGLIVNYTEGRNARTDDGAPLPDEDVIAFTVDFRPQTSFLKGLWLRVRYAEGNRGSPESNRRDVRVILNYSLGVL
jgi:hypothetical protein